MELGVTMKSTLANPDVGDFALDETGNELVLTSLRDEVAQRLFVRLLFFQGEWRRDLNAGLPWYQRILRKSPGDRVIRAVFGQVILNTEGVSSLLRFTYTVNKQRQMELRFECRLADGTVFRSTEFAPYVIDL